jgi:alpha-glucosidase (family GH31 glycosyl hydrolase)
MAVVEYEPDPVRLRFADDRGPFLRESRGGAFGYLDTGVTISWNVSSSERIYGLGQRAFRGLNRVGQVRDMAADHDGHVGGDVPIAFWVSTRGYGVLVDNPGVAQFDLRRKGRITFSACDGYISYYVLWGPAMTDVLRRYAALTGRSPLPPRWLLGPMFSRIPGGRVPGYRRDAELVALAKTLRERDVPADALILDYQWDEWIGAFRWSSKQFARARWMVQQLGRRGIATIVQLKPAVNLPAPTMDEVKRDKLAITRRDGTIHTGNFHRGRSAFLDFFNPRTQRWYGRQLDRPQADGVAGWWTDEGDWLGFESQAVRDLDRCGAGIRNLYNNAWAGTIYDWQRRRTSRRVVNITRTGSAGIQRFAASIWSGDVSATWDGLADQLQMGLSLGMSGVPFWNSDGGGFLRHPTPELYIRWAQFAAFCPLTRFHGCGPREPWHFGERAERVVREILQWRMRLIPYIYATVRQAHANGTPIMRAMAMVDPDDRRFANLSSQYFFGDALLVRPITETMSVIRKRGGLVRTLLTPGTWYDFWTGQRVRSGKSATTCAALDRVPVFVRGPAIVVLAEPADCTSRQSWDTLTARIYAGNATREWLAGFDLYEDDATTYAYEKGAFLETRMTARRKSGRSFMLTLRPSGKRPRPVPPQRTWRLELFGVPGRPTVRANDRTHQATRMENGWCVALDAWSTTKGRTLTVEW